MCVPPAATLHQPHNGTCALQQLPHYTSRTRHVRTPTAATLHQPHTARARSNSCHTTPAAHRTCALQQLPRYTSSTRHVRAPTAATLHQPHTARARSNSCHATPAAHGTCALEQLPHYTSRTRHVRVTQRLARIYIHCTLYVHTGKHINVRIHLLSSNIFYTICASPVEPPHSPAAATSQLRRPASHSPGDWHLTAPETGISRPRRPASHSPGD